MLANSTALLTRQFGVDAQLDGQPVRGVFTNPAVVSGLGGPGAVSARPTFWAHASGLPAQPVGLRLVVPTVGWVTGGTFDVMTVLPDGTGYVLLELQEVRT